MADLKQRIEDLHDSLRNGRIMDAMREFYADDVVMTALAVGDGVTIYENVMDWIDVNDQSIHVEQVVVAKWRGGRIVHERFYYNMG